MELVEGETLAQRRAGARARRRGARDRAPDRRRARGRAREGHRPSGSEARQREAHAGRDGQGPRLRPGESAQTGWIVTGRDLLADDDRPVHAGRRRSGTAAYMSPEQARGKTVDKRTDVWAFGAASLRDADGQDAFRGNTVSDTLAAVLKTDPDWAALPSNTPASVRRLLRRCLERDPKKRLHDIADARLDLDDAPPAGPDERPGRESGRRTRAAGRWVAAIVAGILLGAVAGGLAAAAAGPRPRGPRRAPRPPPDHRRRRDPADLGHRRMSPDGSRVVLPELGGRRDAACSSARSTRWSPCPVPGSEGGYGPCFSPDGQSVAFFSIFGGTRQTGLVRPRIAGGTPTLVVELPSSAVAGLTFTCDWSEAGHILLAGRRRWSSGSRPPEGIRPRSRPSTRPAARRATSSPTGSPGSQGLLCVAVSAGGRPGNSSARGDGTPGRVLVEGATSPRFAPHRAPPLREGDDAVRGALRSGAG